jgi:hypothetical protein
MLMGIFIYMFIGSGEGTGRVGGDVGVESGEIKSKVRKTLVL